MLCLVAELDAATAVSARMGSGLTEGGFAMKAPAAIGGEEGATRSTPNRGAGITAFTERGFSLRLVACSAAATSDLAALAVSDAGGRNAGAAALTGEGLEMDGCAARSTEVTEAPIGRSAPPDPAVGELPNVEEVTKGTVGESVASVAVACAVACAFVRDWFDIIRVS